MTSGSAREIGAASVYRTCRFDRCQTVFSCFLLFELGGFYFPTSPRCKRSPKAQAAQRKFRPTRIRYRSRNRVFAAIASDNKPSASDLETDPTRIRSFRLFTTGMFR